MNFIPQRGYVNAFDCNVGSIVQIDGEPCRISGRNPDGTTTFVSNRSGQHYTIDRAKFEEMLHQGSFVPHAQHELIDDKKLSVPATMLMKTRVGTRYTEIAAYRNAFVKALLAIPRGDRHSAIQSGLLERTHQEYFENNGYPIWLQGRAVPSRASVYRWLKFAERRADPRLLSPKFNLCGARGPRFLPEIEALVAKYIEEFFFGVKESQFTAAAVSIQREVSNRIKNNPDLAHLRAPSFGTIIRRITALGGERRMTHEKSRRISRWYYKHVEAPPDLIYPLARCEIDHTQVDVWVLDDETKQVIARPYLTVVFDHTSRVIVGYLLTVETPNAADVLAALRHAMLPKLHDDLTALGVKNPWPVYGVLRGLGTDRGRDFLSHAVLRAMEVLSIDSVAMPPRTPQMKGRVERFFRTLNHMLFHRLPGTTKENTKSKADRKPQEEARVTFQELNALIATTICDRYHQSYHSELGCSPMERWSALIREHGEPIVLSGEKIREVTRLSQIAVVTRQGIMLDGVRYSNEVIGRLRSMAHAYARSSPEIEILRDPDDISRIFYKEPTSSTVIEIPAIKPANLRGISMRTYALMRKRQPSGYSYLKDEKRAADIEELQRRIRKIVRRRKPRICADSEFLKEPIASETSSVLTRTPKASRSYDHKSSEKTDPTESMTLPDLTIKSIDD